MATNKKTELRKIAATAPDATPASRKLTAAAKIEGPSRDEYGFAYGRIGDSAPKAESFTEYMGFKDTSKAPAEVVSVTSLMEG